LSRLRTSTPTTDLAELFHELTEDRSGMHLSRVAEQLTEESDRPWSTNDVRTALKAAGIPVRHSVRVDGAVLPGSPS
jgi:GTP cyclohydrolase FolE2